MVYTARWRQQIKRGTTTALGAAKPLLLPGEPCYDKTSNTLRIGDGITPYDKLPVFDTHAGMPDAPEDSNIYLRKTGSWAVRP